MRRLRHRSRAGARLVPAPVGAVRPAGRVRGDRGSASTELVLAAPLLILLVLVMVGLGRATSTHLDVTDAAHQAARAASLARDPVQAQEAARETAEDALTNVGLSCREPRVAVDTGDFTAGGRVTVTVSCTTELTDLGIPFPGVHRTTTGRSSSPIDRFRQTGEAP